MDGISFIQEGTRNSGAAVAIGQKEVIWPQTLPRSASTQRAEISALKQALKWAEGNNYTVTVNIYTDR